MFRDVLFVNWIPFGASLMKKCGKHVIIYKYFMPMIADILIVGVTVFSSRKLLRIKVTPDLHLTYSKNGGNLGLILKMKNIACLSILLTKHVNYTYLYLFKFVLYSIEAFKANY